MENFTVVSHRLFHNYGIEYQLNNYDCDEDYGLKTPVFHSDHLTYSDFRILVGDRQQVIYGIIIMGVRLCRQQI